MNKIKIKGPRVGVFSDIHIGLGQDSHLWHKNILKFADWVCEIYNQKGINEIFIPGDIFHNRNEISVNTLNTCTDFFNRLKDFKIYVSTGNHDCYYKDRSDVNSISLLGGWPNIFLVDKEPKIFSIENSDKTLSMIPWGTDVENIPVSDICFGHFEINSFKMNTYKTCEHGMDSKNLLQKSPFILSGHFHQRTHRVYSDGEVLYVGSPYQQNFGDSGDSRGIYILDLFSNKFEFIENNISPQHLKISLARVLNKEIDTNFLKNNVPGNMVSFIIDANLASDKISLIASRIQNLNPQFFRIDYQNIESNVTQISSHNQYNSVDIMENIEDFINVLEINYKLESLTYLKDLYTKLAV
jgi:DNA repair exonuclease SbcCD nuclease subunit